MVASVLLVGALAVGGAVVVLSGGSDGSAGNADDERAELVELVTAPGDLVAALQDERNMASITLLGMAEIVEPRFDDNAAARDQTDAAIAEFEAAAAQASEAGEPAYQEALGALRGLGALRSEIDGRPQPGDLSEDPYAREIHGRYGEMVTALLDANMRLASGIDDPELRRGAELFATTLEQVDLLSRLTRELTVDISAWNTSEWITRVARLRGEIEQGRGFVREHADGGYADAAARLDAGIEAAGALDLIDQALTTGQAELGELVPSLTAMGDSCHTFLADVERILSATG